MPPAEKDIIVTGEITHRRVILERLKCLIEGSLYGNSGDHLFLVTGEDEHKRLSILSGIVDSLEVDICHIFFTTSGLETRTNTNDGSEVPISDTLSLLETFLNSHDLSNQKILLIVDINDTIEPATYRRLLHLIDQNVTGNIVVLISGTLDKIKHIDGSQNVDSIHSSLSTMIPLDISCADDIEVHAETIGQDDSHPDPIKHMPPAHESIANHKTCDIVKTEQPGKNNCLSRTSKNKAIADYSDPVISEIDFNNPSSEPVLNMRTQTDFDEKADIESKVFTESMSDNQTKVSFMDLAYYLKSSLTNNPVLMFVSMVAVTIFLIASTDSYLHSQDYNKIASAQILLDITPDTVSSNLKENITNTPKKDEPAPIIEDHPVVLAEATQTVQEDGLPEADTPEDKQESVPEPVRILPEDKITVVENNTDSTEIERNLSIAASQVAAQKLTTPEGDNAFETYKDILNKEPDNKDAIEGIINLKQIYIGWAADAYEKGKSSRALTYYERAHRIDPYDSNLSNQIDTLEMTMNDTSHEKIMTMDNIYTALKDEPYIPSQWIITDEFVNQREKTSGFTPLMLAVLHNNIELVKQLVRSNANILSVDYLGNSSLMLAVENNNLAISKYLLAHSANTNQKNTEGNSPLHIATLNANNEIVDLLLTQGADADSKNINGQTAFDLAKEDSTPKIASILHKAMFESEESNPGKSLLSYIFKKDNYF